MVIVFFFLIESKDRSLEEIDTMYLQKVNPITSSKWRPNDTSSGVKEPVVTNEEHSA